MDVFFRCFDGSNAEQINNDIKKFCEEKQAVELNRSEPVVVACKEFNQFMVRSKFRQMNWVELEDWKSRHYTPIKELGLSRRAYESLWRHAINYAEEVIAIDRKRILSWDNVGIKTLEEIYKALKEKGFDIPE